MATKRFTPPSGPGQSALFKPGEKDYDPNPPKPSPLKEVLREAANPRKKKV